MSNSENKRLNELLARKDDQSPDDFEKEALEGFAMIGSEAESIDLKTKLDERMRQELFAQQKTRSPFYWIAAAAMLIIMGLSVWFILSDTGEVAARKDLATARPEKTTTANSSAEKSFEAKAAELKPLVNAAEETPSGTSKNINLFKAAPPATPIELAERASAPSMETESKSTTLNEHARLNDSAADFTMEQLPTDGFVAAKHEADAIDRKTPAGDEDLEIPSKKNLSANTKKENASKAKHINQAEEAHAPLGALSQPALATPENNCNYEGGAQSMHADIQEKLKAIGLNKIFDAILSIDQTKKVVQVQFVKADLLTSQDLEKIAVVLKTLHKFNPDVKQGAFPCVFKLSYRPSGQ